MPPPRGFGQPAPASRAAGVGQPLPPPATRPNAAPVPNKSGGGGGRLLQMPLIPMSDQPAAAPSPITPTARPAGGAVQSFAARPKAGGKKAFGPGSIVEHPRYGRGTVLRREGDGEDAKLTVSFPGHGMKKLFEKFAGLNKES